MKDLIYIITRGYTQTVLESSPEGWDDTLVNIERSTTLLGVLRAYSVSLKFMKDGARILREAFYQDWINTGVQFEIRKLDRLLLTYNTEFTGIFDFTTFVDTQHSVEITVKDAGLSNYIKANGKTKYDINVFDPNPSRFKFETNIIEHTNLIRLVEVAFDLITEGKFQQGVYGLDTSAIVTGLSNIVVTNGLALRGGTLYSVNTSFDDLLQTIKALTGCSAGVEVVQGRDTLIFRHYTQLFKAASQVYDLGRASNIKVSPAQEFLCSRIKTGHVTPSYSDLSSKYEFNCITEYVGPANGIDKEFDISTRFRADWTGIHNIIQNPENESEDNEAFLLVLQDGQDIYRVPEYGQIKKVDNPSVISTRNTRISPKRLFFLHEFYISSLIGKHGLYASFASSDFDNINNMTAVQGGNYLNEGGGYSSDDPFFFKPVLLEFDAEIPRDFARTLMLNPYGFISFTYDGESYSGFIMKAGIKLYGRSSARLTTLSHPNNNLTKLIR